MSNVHHLYTSTKDGHAVTKCEYHYNHRKKITMEKQQEKSQHLEKTIWLVVQEAF